MSEKYCDYHECKKKKIYRRLFAGFLIFIIAILFIILLVWLILRPTKPRFTLRDVTVYQFNISTPNILTSNLQVTISSRNPNDNIAIHYDKLDIFAFYRNQQITRPVALPPTYQDHNSVNDWSPFVYGNEPVAPYLDVPLSQDLAAGTLMLHVKVIGRLRWKVGTWISGNYHIYVNCPAYIAMNNRNTGVAVGSAMKYQVVQPCSTDI